MAVSQLYDTALSTTTQNFRERDVRKNPVVQYSMDCPVTSRAGKEPMPLSSRPEWVIKLFATANTGGRIEGAPVVAGDGENNLSNKYLASTRFQKTSRIIFVTREAKMMMKQYGVEGADVFEDNKKDKGTELQVDIEATFLSDNESVPPVNDTTASTTRGIPRWASKADARFTDTDTTPNTAIRTPSASIVVSKNVNGTDTTEQNIRTVITSIASSRRKNFGEALMVCSPNMRNALALFTYLDKSATSTAAPVRRWNQQEGEISTMATLYKSDHGTLEALTSYQLDVSVLCLILDMDSVKIAYAEAPMFEKLPSDGANERGQWEAIWMTKLLNPFSAGKIITGATA